MFDSEQTYDDSNKTLTTSNSTLNSDLTLNKPNDTIHTGMN